jgi:LysM repeat protein
MYKVQSGDTLLGIAIRHGIPLEALMSANNLQDTLIRVGQELIIPPR